MVDTDGGCIKGHVEGNEASNPPKPQIPFKDDKPLILCSWNECLNGHKWKPAVIAVECPECKSPSIMVRMENCPFCNEPTKKISLRSDHIPRGAGVSKRCSGEKIYGESLDIQLEREHWKEFEVKDG
jgi:hypothetical protein